MSKTFFSRLMAAIGVMGAFCHAGGAELQGTESTMAAWPETWKESYKKLETYISARSEGWPSGVLSISADGMLSHGVHFAQEREQHLTIRFFSKGRDFLSMADNSDLFGKGRAPLFPAGEYKAALLICGSFGYQYLYPLTSFRVAERAKKEEVAGSGQKLVEMLPPAVGESFWPNERLLLFEDFHIFPASSRFSGPLSPRDIEAKNYRVSPEVTLTLSQSGTIRRNLLPAALEKCLRWRVYRDGELIEQASAEGAASYEIKAGMGSYVACIGIYGPDGFMPVSNIMTFPLFQDGEAGMRVVPKDEDRDGTPDILKEFARHREQTASSDNDVDGDGVTDAEEEADEGPNGGGHLVYEAPGNPAMSTYIELWETWRYELSYRRESQDSTFKDSVYRQK